jgi:hypothetical protein
MVHKLSEEGLPVAEDRQADELHWLVDEEMLHPLFADLRYFNAHSVLMSSVLVVAEYEGELGGVIGSDHVVKGDRPAHLRNRLLPILGKVAVSLVEVLNAFGIRCVGR